MNQKNDNFIDKTFTVLEDILLKVLPATKDEKQAFSYYRYGMSAQSSGDYAEALETCRCTYLLGKRIWNDPGTGSVQIQLLFASGTRDFWLLRAVAVPKWSQNGTKCLSACL